MSESSIASPGRRRQLASIGAMVAMPLAVWSTPSRTESHRGQRAFHSRVEQLELPSAMLAWRAAVGEPVQSRKGKATRWQAAVGMDALALYPVGSVGKLLVGLVSRRALAHAGCKVGDRVHDHLNDQWRGLLNPDTTWQQLAQHQAGLPEPIAHGPFQAAVAEQPARRWTASELAGVAAVMPQRLSNRSFAYSNLNTTAMARALEGLLGKPFDQLWRAHLPPQQELAIGNGWDHPTSTTWRESGVRAWRHARQGRPIAYGTLLTDVTDYNPSWAGEGGDWCASLQGLVDLGVALLREPWQELGAPVDWVADSPTTGESYGWHIVRRGDWLGHTGDVPGFSCSLWTRARDGAIVTAIVSLSNTASGQNPADLLVREHMQMLG